MLKGKSIYTNSITIIYLYNIQVNKMAIINEYVTANQKRLKRVCFKIFKGDGRFEDLFQEVYLKLIEMPEAKIQAYKNKMWYLYWLSAGELYLKRTRKSSPLSNINGVKVGELDRIETPDYLTDLEEFIESEMNKEHDFAPVMVFMECQEKSMHELSRETGINMFALSHYNAQGREKLKRMIA